MNQHSQLTTWTEILKHNLWIKTVHQWAMSSLTGTGKILDKGVPAWETLFWISMKKSIRQGSSSMGTVLFGSVSVWNCLSVGPLWVAPIINNELQQILYSFKGIWFYKVSLHTVTVSLHNIIWSAACGHKNKRHTFQPQHFIFKNHSFQFKPIYFGHIDVT